MIKHFPGKIVKVQDVREAHWLRITNILEDGQFEGIFLTVPIFLPFRYGQSVKFNPRKIINPEEDTG